jgi:flagellar biogenesis protein FliO
MSDLRLQRRALLIVFSAANAICTAAETNTVALASPLPDVGTSLLRLAGAMIFVLAVFFGGVWCFRNWQRLTIHKRSPSRLQVLEVRTLANRQALYLVACDHEKLLIGSSAAGLSTLCRMPNDQCPSSNDDCRGPHDDLGEDSRSPAEPAFARSLRAALPDEP